MSVPTTSSERVPNDMRTIPQSPPQRAYQRKEKVYHELLILTLVHRADFPTAWGSGGRDRLRGVARARDVLRRQARCGRAISRLTENGMWGTPELPRNEAQSRATRGAVQAALLPNSRFHAAKAPRP